MHSHEFIVIGCDGQLGSRLAEDLRQFSQHVYGTYFLKKHVFANCSFLDLSADISDWQLPNCVDAAFLCAAVTSLETCRTQPERSRKINVENTLSLAEKISQRGAALFFPSSNLVFDGLAPLRKATDSVSPLCEYGKQKAETERGLNELTDRVAIVRFSKIIGPNFALMRKWITDMRRGKAIHPFSDMVFSPISLDFAIPAVIAIMQRRSYGVWQISAKEDVTYEQTARYLARKAGFSQNLIQPISTTQSGLRFETVPKYTTLDTTRLKEALGLEPPDVWEAVDEFLESNT